MKMMGTTTWRTRTTNVKAGSPGETASFLVAFVGARGASAEGLPMCAVPQGRGEVR